MASVSPIQEHGLDVLPRELRGLARTCGISAALRLVEWKGGTWVYVPVKLKGDHELVRRIGMEGAEWLVKEHAGEVFKVPRALSYLLQQRDAEIRDRFVGGETAQSLALEYGLTERRIWQILSAAGVTANERQSDLF